MSQNVRAGWWKNKHQANDARFVGGRMCSRRFSVEKFALVLGGRDWSNSVLSEYLCKMIRFVVSVHHARTIWTCCKLRATGRYPLRWQMLALLMDVGRLLAESSRCHD